MIAVTPVLLVTPGSLCSEIKIFNTLIDMPRHADCEIKLSFRDIRSWLLHVLHVLLFLISFIKISEQTFASTDWGLFYG